MSARCAAIAALHRCPLRALYTWTSHHVPRPLYFLPSFHPLSNCAPTENASDAKHIRTDTTVDPGQKARKPSISQVKKGRQDLSTGTPATEVIITQLRDSRLAIKCMKSLEQLYATQELGEKEVPCWSQLCRDETEPSEMQRHVLPTAWQPWYTPRVSPASYHFGGVGSVCVSCVPILVDFVNI